MKDVAMHRWDNAAALLPKAQWPSLCSPSVSVKEMEWGGLKFTLFETVTQLINIGYKI